MLDGMYVTKSISTGLYPNLDLWTANKLQLQLRLSIHKQFSETLHCVNFYETLSTNAVRANLHHCLKKFTPGGTEE